jgi:hypothetical protein
VTWFDLYCAFWIVMAVVMMILILGLAIIATFMVWREIIQTVCSWWRDR